MSKVLKRYALFLLLAFLYAMLHPLILETGFTYKELCHTFVGVSLMCISQSIFEMSKKNNI